MAGARTAALASSTPKTSAATARVSKHSGALEAWKAATAASTVGFSRSPP